MTDTQATLARLANQLAEHVKASPAFQSAEHFKTLNMAFLPSVKWSELTRQFSEATKAIAGPVEQHQKFVTSFSDAIQAAIKPQTDLAKLFLRSNEVLDCLYTHAKMSTADIASALDLESKSTVGYWLDKHKIPTRRTGGRANLKDLTTQRFTRLEVIALYESDGNGSRWICKCDCGNTKIVRRRSLVSKATKSCGCLKKELAFRGCGDLSRCYWNRITKGAKSRGISVDITLEDAWRQFEDQKGLCTLSGIEISIVRDYTHRHREHTASLDRIDHNFGYTRENIQWVHRDLNMMRRTMPVKEFIARCRKVAEHNERS